MPPAERGVLSGLKPQSQRHATCPPHASTALGLVARNRPLIGGPDEDVATFTSPSLTYETSTSVPPYSVITRSAAGSVAMLVDGWDAAGSGPAPSGSTTRFCVGSGIGAVLAVGPTPV